MGRASRRKTANRSRGVLDKARNIIERVGGPKEIIIRSHLPQEEKISHALCELLESEVPGNSPVEEYRAALQFIVIAWNMSLLDAGKRFQALQELAARIQAVDEVERRELLTDVERLIASKDALFPHDQRVVVSASVRFEGNEVRVTAAALTAPPPSVVGR
jgi:hypothetical protein